MLQNRGAKNTRVAQLTMPNTFPARERKFISDLAGDLNLDVSWDEYDDEDQNLVIWRLPGTVEAEGDTEASAGAVDGEDEGQWEDVDEEEDEESKGAVDRVLKKYEKAAVVEDDEEGDFDVRHERDVQEKMDEWKRGYYHVSPCSLRVFLESSARSSVTPRANWNSRMTIRSPWAT